MFSQVSVIVFTLGEGSGLVCVSGPLSAPRGLFVSGTRSPLARSRDWYVRGDCWVFPGVGIESPEDGVVGTHPPPGHRTWDAMGCSRQADSTHPTGMVVGLL